MKVEAQERAFTNRASNGRLILCYMSKQGVPASAYLTKPQVHIATLKQTHTPIHTHALTSQHDVLPRL
jgi:hypothetical protein